MAGQFTSADTTLAGGLNRYAYVSGNPETFVDHSGHELREGDNGEGGGISGGETGGDDVGGGGGGTVPGDNDLPIESTVHDYTTGGDEITYDLGSAGADTYETDAQGNIVYEYDAEGDRISVAHVDQQAEANSQDRLNQGEQPRGDDGQNGGDPYSSSTTPSASTDPTTTNSSSYEDRVKAANGDPTVGEPNGHQWNGSQPVTDANGGPIDKGWAGPDVVRDYDMPDETWIEAKSNVEQEPDFMAKVNKSGKLRNLTQLGRYAGSGRPFEYWVDAEPSNFTRNTIESWGGTIVIFP